MSYINAFHVLIILAALAGLFFFFKLVSLMFESRTALFASALLMLHPIFFAHSQYNSKDIPLSLRIRDDPLFSLFQIQAAEILENYSRRTHFRLDP